MTKEEKDTLRVRRAPLSSSPPREPSAANPQATFGSSSLCHRPSPSILIKHPTSLLTLFRPAPPLPPAAPPPANQVMMIHTGVMIASLLCIILPYAAASGGYNDYLEEQCFKTQDAGEWWEHCAPLIDKDGNLFLFFGSEPRVFGDPPACYVSMPQTCNVSPAQMARPLGPFGGAVDWDTVSSCEWYATSGECTANPGVMSQYCQQSCAREHGILVDSYCSYCVQTYTLEDSILCDPRSLFWVYFGILCP